MVFRLVMATLILACFHFATQAVRNEAGVWRKGRRIARLRVRCAKLTKVVRLQEAMLTSRSELERLFGKVSEYKVALESPPLMTFVEAIARLRKTRKGVTERYAMNSGRGVHRYPGRL